MPDDSMRNYAHEARLILSGKADIRLELAHLMALEEIIYHQSIAVAELQQVVNLLMINDNRLARV